MVIWNFFAFIYNLLCCKFMWKMKLIIIPNTQKKNAAGYCFKIFFIEIVNKPGVDAVKYAALYPKKRVGPAIFFVYVTLYHKCRYNEILSFRNP